MKRSELEAVRAASKRERAHYAHDAPLSRANRVCDCGQCQLDRETIAAAMPEILRIVDAYDNMPRLSPTNFGDLD